MELKNMMEHAVNQAIDDVKKYHDFCDCPRCRLDISALALNSVSSRYVVTSKGESYGRAELLALQKDVDLISIVLDAVKKVQDRPGH